ncbi:MAG: hypothetical protein ABIX12_09130 [Rubrivivax sp.]
MPAPDRGVVRDLPIRRRTIIVPLGLALWYPMTTLRAAAPDASAQRFPDVVGVKVSAAAADRFQFDVTVSSPYDSARRYADGIRVRSAADGTVYGERALLHDHANEQPFTRDVSAVRVPAAVTHVVVEARDREFGYGGRTVRVRLPGR